MSKISLIIQREYNQRVKKRSFILTTILMPLLMVSLMAVPALMMMYSGDDKIREVVVIDQSRVIAAKLENRDNVVFVKDSSGVNNSYAEAQEKFPEAYGFLLIGADVMTNPSSMNLYTRENSTLSFENGITGQVSDIIEQNRIAATNIPGLDSIMNSIRARAQLKTFTIDQENQVDKQSSSVVSMGVAYIGGFMIYMFIFIYGAFVMNGVIEEKQNRILEVVVSSVKPFQLMMGKIVGVALVALTQLLIWIFLFVVFFMVLQNTLFAGVGPDMVTSQVPGEAVEMARGMSPELTGLFSTLTDPGFVITVLGSYLLYFIGGYLLYAAMFAAVGSAVDNVQDTQQLQIPITIPLILALIIAMGAMKDPNSAVAFWFSIIPFTSPIVMMARIPYGIPMWEVGLSLVLLYATFVGMTWISGKIYRTGILMYGKKPSLKELIKWAKYKN